MLISTVTAVVVVVPLLMLLSAVAVAVLDISQCPQDVLRHIDHSHEVQVILHLFPVMAAAEVRFAPNIKLVPLMLYAIDKVLSRTVNLQRHAGMD